MKWLLCAMLILCPLVRSHAEITNCDDMAKRTEQTFKKMDEALKLKAGMLLGEMETAKSALEGCIDRNQALSTQMAMVWFLGDAGLVAIMTLLIFHQKRMQRAIKVLSNLLKAKDPDHTIKYVPSQSLYRWTLGLLGAMFGGLNIVALFL